MEGFDAIYYEDEDTSEEAESTLGTDVTTVPDPVVIRGAGNMTV